MLHYWCTKNDWRVCNIIYGHSVISGKTQLVRSSSLQLVAAAGAPWWPAAVVEASGVRYVRRRSIRLPGADDDRRRSNHLGVVDGAHVVTTLASQAFPTSLAMIMCFLVYVSDEPSRIESQGIKAMCLAATEPRKDSFPAAVEPIWGRMISSMMYEVMNLTTRTHTIWPPCVELLWLMLRYGCLM